MRAPLKKDLDLSDGSYVVLEMKKLILDLLKFLEGDIVLDERTSYTPLRTFSAHSKTVRRT